MNQRANLEKASAVPLGFRLAGWVSRSGLRGSDRIASLVLKMTPVPSGVVEGQFRGLRFRVIPRHDGSLRDFLLLPTRPPALASIFEAALQPGDVVIDVGANVGVYAALAAQLVGPAGRVLALEPLATIRLSLQEFIQLNALTQVTILPVAAGAAAGQVELHVIPGASGLTSALRQPEARLCVSAAMVTLDSLLHEECPIPPRLIKIDVEGFELDVLRGASSILSSPEPPLLVFESDENLLERAGASFLELRNWLHTRHGYELFGLTPGGLRPLPQGASAPVSPNTLAARPSWHTEVLSRLAHTRFRRNQNC